MSYRWGVAAGFIILVGLIVSLAPQIVERLSRPSADPSTWLATYPETIGPRSGDLTVNFSGYLADGETADWRLNDGPWAPVGQGDPRARAPGFVIEVPPDQLKASGKNSLVVRVQQEGGNQQEFGHEFSVEPATQPGDVMPEPHDGLWEWRPDLAAVRPMPGHEGYDRLFILNPQIAGGRHVKATVTFDRSTQGWTHRLRYGEQYGFGVAPLWGGHPDPAEARPRRGWLYGLSWFYAREGGFGSEAARREGGEPIQVATSYVDWSPIATVRIDGFARPVIGEERQFLGWCLASVLSTDTGEVRPEPLFVEPDILPRQDYAAGLIAHRAAATFSDLSWQPLADLAASSVSGQEACAAYQPEPPAGG